jgi:hypothetical protein
MSSAVAADAAPSAAQSAFCRALDAVAAEARRSEKPQEFAIIKAADEPFAFMCRRGKAPTARDFCSAAMPVVGLEFTHVFPWRVYDCLVKGGVRPKLERTEQYTGLVGRNRIVHLQSTFRNRSMIEVRWRPSGDFSDDAEFKGYYGEYQVVVSPPPRPVKGRQRRG